MDTMGDIKIFIDDEYKATVKNKEYALIFLGEHLGAVKYLSLKQKKKILMSSNSIKVYDKVKIGKILRIELTRIDTNKSTVTHKNFGIKPNDKNEYFEIWDKEMDVYFSGSVSASKSNDEIDWWSTTGKIGNEIVVWTQYKSSIN